MRRELQMWGNRRWWAGVASKRQALFEDESRRRKQVTWYTLSTDTFTTVNGVCCKITGRILMNDPNSSCVKVEKQETVDDEVAELQSNCLQALEVNARWDELMQGSKGWTRDVRSEEFKIVVIFLQLATEKDVSVWRKGREVEWENVNSSVERDPTILKVQNPLWLPLQSTTSPRPQGDSQRTDLYTQRLLFGQGFEIPIPFFSTFYPKCRLAVGEKATKCARFGSCLNE